MIVFIFKMDTIFNSSKTEKAFLSWAKLWDSNPQESHPLDVEMFHEFAKTYFLEKENVSREIFVKYAKKIIPTTNDHNRGLVQRTYDHLQTIVLFLIDSKRKHWIIS